MTARHWRIVEVVFRLAVAANCFVAAALYRDYGGGLCLGLGLAQLMLLAREHLGEESQKASRAVIDNQREIIDSLRRSLVLSELYKKVKADERGES